MSKREHGPRQSFEKPKNFKQSLNRLLKSLNNFKKFIFISLVLAAISAILSLVAPNKLSDLTNEISNGIIPDKKNIEEITNIITDDLKEENLNAHIKEALVSSNISIEDKMMFNQEIIKLQDENTSKLEVLENLPTSIKSILFKDVTYQNKTITSQDKLDFLKVMASIKDQKDTKQIYKSIEKLPESIKTLIMPNMNMNVIKNIALFLTIIYIISALFNYIQSLLMTDVSNKFAKKLRTGISTKINKLPLNYFDINETGDILSRVTNDVDTIAQSMNQSLATLVSSITLFLGSVIMMFTTNSLMAITAIISSLIGFVFVAMILSKSQKYFMLRQKELGRLNGHIEEIYSGLNVVKAYNGEKQAEEEFDKLNKSLYNCNRKSQFLSGLMMPLMSFVGNLGYVAVCIVGALLVSKGIITFGVIVAFMIYVRLFINPLSQIAQAMTSLQSTLAAGERVFEFLDEKELIVEKDKKHLDKDKVRGEISFEHVKFGYNEDKTIIKDFTAQIKPKSKVAIVGPTGAGKTTMVNLLMKFYEINDGDIKIDGISTKDLTRENIHELFTMVLQDTWLFDGTVKDNIIYNRKNISMTKVKEVCKLVGIDHFINTLPDGYNSVLNENDSTSAGEKQLLTIARGMIESSPFLILDEATSNVDTRTEELVQKAMDKLTEGKTSFIIAHRLSTIKNADLILVMRDGNIVEQGNHDELMKENGFYANLYNSQFEKTTE